MINVKKGTGFTLEQSDFTGAAVSTVPITAGEVVYLDNSGNIQYATAALSVPNGAGGRVGFALSGSTEGSVIASGRVPVLALDGNSVIETDQFDGSVGSYTIGQNVTASSSGNGNITLQSVTVGATPTAKVLGVVVGNRQLTQGNSIPTTVIAIKLAA